MSRRILATVFLALAAVPAYAGSSLDAQTNTPYEFQVVLHFSKHPLVKTEYFQEQVERELRDNLRVALGKLATVSMKKTHPWIKDIQEKGLQGALKDSRGLSEIKTHFILIDYVNGRYEIKTRQYDGLTGLASPVVRQRWTADRQLVARTATLMVDQDFGLVGTPLSPLLGSTEKVELAIKGSALGVALERWVKKDEVFAIGVITQDSKGLTSQRAPWALLQVEQKLPTGNYQCNLLHRYTPAVPEMAGLVGYRCLKLGTAQGRLSLRLVDDRLRTPLDHRAVQIRNSPTADQAERFTTRADGLIKTEKNYPHVAFVRIAIGSQSFANIPVEVLEHFTIDCDMKVDPKAEERAQITLRRDRWRRRILDTIDTANTISKDLDKIKDAAHEDALKKAEIAKKGLEKDIRALHEEGTALENEAKSMPTVNLGLEDAKQRLAELETLGQELQDLIDKLTTAVAKDTDPNNKIRIDDAEKAAKKEKEAEFEEAIELYDKALKNLADNEKLKEHVQWLKEEWKLKGKDTDKHLKAREFIYKTWRNLKTPAAIKQNLKEARQAFETCKEVGDYLSPVMLHKINLAHENLVLKASEATPDSKDDEAAQAAIIAELSEELPKLDDEVTAYLKKAPPGK